MKNRYSTFFIAINTDGLKATLNKRKDYSMSKSIPIGAVIGLMAATSAVTFIIASNVSLDIFNEKVSSVSEKENLYSKLSEADLFARTNYVGEIDEDKMSDSIVKGYLNGLSDPYAVYYSADEYSSRAEEYTGFQTGLGFSYEKDTSGYAKITSITEGSAADESKLQVNDIIMAVNNVNLLAYPGGYTEAVKLFSSAEGTKVKLQIKRTDEDDKIDFENIDLVSTTNEIISVTGRVNDDKTAYIHISEFNDTTSEQFKNVLSDVLEKGAEKFIFDVRDNAGGKISALTDVLEQILPKGEMARAYYKSESKVLIETKDDDELSYPVAVLINNGTKGEAELFAYILKDEKEAVTIGKTSYGKGVIEEIFICSDGSAIEFSVATMQSNSKVNFTGIGLKPDYDVNQTAEINPYKLSVSEQDKYDTQLVKAYSVINTM